jgi:gluconate 2-dehydrogenase gamma chain
MRNDVGDGSNASISTTTGTTTDGVSEPTFAADGGTNSAPNVGHGLSRRDLLKRAGVATAAGAATAIPVQILSRSEATSAQAPAPQFSPTREPLETLTADEAAALEAIVARLVPTDANGPGATEARAAHYIDRALGGSARNAAGVAADAAAGPAAGGALASSHDAYRAGLASVDAFARVSKGAPFARLTGADQDAVLRDMERNSAAGFESGGGTGSAAFFNLVLAHTLQGTFGDPYYGGNRNFVGWDLLGYPGIRLAVTADQQRLDAALTPVHMSAYDYTMFSTKKPTRGD